MRSGFVVFHCVLFEINILLPFKVTSVALVKQYDYLRVLEDKHL